MAVRTVRRTRYNVPVQKRVFALLAAFAGAFLVFLPLGGSADAATSSGADGDIAFVNGGNILLRSSAPTPLITGAVDPSWSPDGKKLAFSAGGDIETCTLTAGPTCTPVLPPIDTGSSQPVWSPDGSLIAYVAAGDIWANNPAGTSQNQITTIGTVSDPTWSPTAIGKIAFVTGGVINTVDASGGPASPLSFTGAFVGPLSHPAWSPDGTSIAFQASDGTHSQIWVGPASGGGALAKQVTTDPTDKTAPSWAPTSDALVFSETGIGIFSSTQGVGGVWGAPSVLHGPGAADTTPDWQTVAPVPAAAPSINGAGAPQTGQLLSTTNGSWIGASAVFGYQWQRCDAAGNGCVATGGTSVDVRGRLCRHRLTRSASS